MEKNASFEIRDLKISYKVFNGELQVVDGMYLQLNSGERMGLVGEAGCGKTTTLKSVLSILPKNAIIHSGEILFNGEDILKFDTKKCRNFARKIAP